MKMFRAVGNSLLTILVFITTSLQGAPVVDEVFQQSRSERVVLSPELAGAKFRKILITRDDVVFVLTDRGVARVIENRLVLDQGFRPLSKLKARDLALNPAGDLFYLFEDHWLSNDQSGRPYGRFNKTGSFEPSIMAVAADGKVFLMNAPGSNPAQSVLMQEGLVEKFLKLPWESFEKLYPTDDGLFAVSAGNIAMYYGTNLTSVDLGGNVGIQCMARFRDKMFIGTTNGILTLNSGVDGRPNGTGLRRDVWLPNLNITALAATANGLWAGTARGAFFKKSSGQIHYFASKRWLDDDLVLDLAVDRHGNAHILTSNGVSRILFEAATLESKARYYQDKIRQRHIRYGLCSELYLSVAGDPGSAQMIDTDNDGSWNNYYMASQAFRFGATGDQEARRHAWETFAAFERMLEITGTNGFMARTLERRGFKYSDTDRWRDPADPKDSGWEWKGHTSSDELIAHTFGAAVLWECAAKTDAEKSRIATFIDKIMSHILRNNYYYVDVDGRPTLWGRWHPEYVNAYPPTVFDRRLNSAEIIAMLQFAHRVTGKQVYRDKGFELLQNHAYLKNITNSVKQIAPSPGVVFQGITMGDEWNHSDDFLAFDTYWVLVRFAFNEELRRQFSDSVQDHWDVEKIEKNPIWNFVHLATCPGVEGDVEGAVWTLRNFPLDLKTWRVENSQRRDVTLLEPNFREQMTKELLPPDERPMTRWNGNPFRLDGGDGGHIEFAGDEFLLPYWMGRYLKLIR